MKHTAPTATAARGTRSNRRSSTRREPTEELTDDEREYRFERTGLDHVPYYWDLIDDYTLTWSTTTSSPARKRTTPAHRPRKNRVNPTTKGAEHEPRAPQQEIFAREEMLNPEETLRRAEEVAPFVVALVELPEGGYEDRRRPACRDPPQPPYEPAAREHRRNLRSEPLPRRRPALQLAGGRGAGLRHARWGGASPGAPSHRRPAG